MHYNDSQVFLAEVVGTFLFIVIGNGGICNALLPGTKGHGIGYLGIGMNFGLAVFIPLQCVGHISRTPLIPLTNFDLLLRVLVCSI